MNNKYTDEELDGLIKFGEPYNRDGDILTYNALAELKLTYQKLKIAQKALEFYSNRYNYMYDDQEWINAGCPNDWSGVISTDEGKIAINALQEIKDLK